jgi:hypothetical protein
MIPGSGEARVQPETRAGSRAQALAGRDPGPGAGRCAGLAGDSEQAVQPKIRGRGGGT